MPRMSRSQAQPRARNDRQRGVRVQPQAKPRPVALCTGGSERGRAQLTIAGRQSPGNGDLETREPNGDHLRTEKLFKL
jgi:hypothetical protein